MRSNIEMKVLKLVLIFFTTFSTVYSYAQDVDNTKPMYGEVEKSNEYKKIDKKFIQSCLKEFGSIDSSVVVYTDFAWRYYYNNDLKTAMKRFNQVWLLNPDFPDSYFGFAALLETEGNFEEAKRFYKLGREKVFDNRRASICFQRIADCKEQLNDLEGALEAYKELTKLDSRNSFAFKKIGYFQMSLGNPEEAINAYNKAIELDPEDGMTYNNRGYQNHLLKNYEKAIKDYSKAIMLNPNYISALVNRGITEMQIGQFKEAKTDFDKCIKLAPKAGELRRFLALSELSLNEKANACENLKLAMELGDQIAIKLSEENCK